MACNILSKKKNKKWTREECRVRYVQHTEEIGIRTLSKIANRGHSTVGKWCQEGRWVQQRVQYHDTLRSKVEEKTLEKTSELLSDELSQLNSEHMELFKTIREINGTAFKVLAKDAMGDQNTKPAVRAKKLKSKDMSLALQKYVNNAVSAANMERIIAGAKYSDLNIAIELTERAGYIVSEPIEE